MSPPIEGMLGTSMGKIREMVDVNTIIGDPITTPDGTVIIPVSKVTFGFGSGGSDFPNKSQQELFGGGAGGGVTIVPLAFLVVSGGEVKLLQLSPNNSTADKVVDAVPGLIDKVSGIFGKEKTKKSPSPKEAAE